MRRYLALPLTIALLLTAWVLAKGQGLQQELNDLEVGDHWIYNDLNAGIARATQEGKPLFVLFR